MLIDCGRVNYVDSIIIGSMIRVLQKAMLAARGNRREVIARILESVQRSLPEAGAIMAISRSHAARELVKVEELGEHVAGTIVAGSSQRTNDEATPTRSAYSPPLRPSSKCAPLAAMIGLVRRRSSSRRSRLQ